MYNPIKTIIKTIEAPISIALLNFICELTKQIGIELTEDQKLIISSGIYGICKGVINLIKNIKK